MSDLDWVNGDPVELRTAYAADRSELDATAPDDVSVEDAPRYAGLRFAPSYGGKGAPILYFHGGSWLLGSPWTHRALCAWLAKLTDRRVLSVSYPLAPEYLYPAQRDAARVLLADFLAEESGPVFVAGDSAGGAMALWAAEDRQIDVFGVATFYPAYGLTASASIDAYGPGNPALNAASIGAMYARLGVEPEQIQTDIPVKGAPVLVLAAEQDPLRDDSVALVEALSARPVTYWEAGGEEHAFLHHGGSNVEVRDWLARVGKWMWEVERA